MIPRSTKPIARKKAVRKVRAKARPGRLKGKAMEALRRDRFEMDGYKCQRIIGHYASGFRGDLAQPERCLEPVSWESGHLAHIKAKRIGGDSIENVETWCGDCHRAFHERGPSMQKIIPAKAKP